MLGSIIIRNDTKIVHKARRKLNCLELNNNNLWTYVITIIN